MSRFKPADNAIVEVEDGAADLRAFSDYGEERKVAFVFRPWIPRGMVSILEGDPGNAKSLITLDMAARITTAQGFFGDPTKRSRRQNVLLMADEDPIESVMMPRFRVAGGDAKRIFHVGAHWTFPESADRLASAIKDKRPGLVIIDPINDFLSEQVKVISDPSVRKHIMRPLAEIARDTDTAVLIVRHLRKNRDGPAIDAGAGSTGFGGAVRSVMAVAPDWAAEDQRDAKALVSIKLNVAAAPPSLRYRVTEEGGHPRIEWLGESPLTREDVYSRKGTRGPDPTKRNDAGARLEQLLGDGRTHRRNDVIEQLRAEGFSDSTIQRAARELHVVRTEVRAGQPSMWRLRNVGGV